MMNPPDEHDEIVMTVPISSRERHHLLIALWNNDLWEKERKAGMLGKDEFDQNELDTVMMFEKSKGLVRKLGGNPDRPLYGMADGPTSTW